VDANHPVRAMPSGRATRTVGPPPPQASAEPIAHVVDESRKALRKGHRVPEVEESTRKALAGLSAGKLETLEGALGLREEYRTATGLDERTFALVKIAALVALDAPPASYAWQIANAVEVGVSAEDVLGVLRAVAPQVGCPRVIAAAPEIMLALGLSLPEGENAE
jgi:4-carboxymuconolactone decarboxylase